VEERAHGGGEVVGKIGRKKRGAEEARAALPRMPERCAHVTLVRRATSTLAVPWR
jgi:hypothetical protein